MWKLVQSARNYFASQQCCKASEWLFSFDILTVNWDDHLLFVVSNKLQEMYIMLFTLPPSISDCAHPALSALFLFFFLFFLPQPNMALSNAAGTLWFHCPQPQRRTSSRLLWSGLFTKKRRSLVDWAKKQHSLCYKVTIDARFQRGSKICCFGFLSATVQSAQTSSPLCNFVVWNLCHSM